MITNSWYIFTILLIFNLMTHNSCSSYLRISYLEACEGRIKVVGRISLIGRMLSHISRFCNRTSRARYTARVHSIRSVSFSKDPRILNELPRTVNQSGFLWGLPRGIRRASESFASLTMEQQNKRRAGISGIHTSAYICTHIHTHMRKQINCIWDPPAPVSREYSFGRSWERISKSRILK